MKTKADENRIEPDVIYAYTRADALNDGVLVDVTDLAREAGFRFPVAVTRTIWERYIVPPGDTDAQGQSTSGRLWDVFSVLHAAIRRASGPTDRLAFTVAFLMAPRQHEDVDLISVCGPGDHAEPVLTIMLSEDD